MQKEELVITISPEGKVKVHIKGIKGKKCMDYVDFIKQNIGSVEEQKLTSNIMSPSRR